MKFLTTEEKQKFFADPGFARPGPRASSTTTRNWSPSCPYLPVLKTSIENAVPRPVTPFYPAVTKAIQDNAYAAIKGEKSSGRSAVRHAEVHRNASAK